MARLKDRYLPHSFEGNHQLVPWIDLFFFFLDILFSDQAMLEFTFCLFINYARECVREKSKGRSGVRMKAESETGERHTPPVRVKPTCLARKYRSCQRFAPCKIDLRKVRLFAVQEVYWQTTVICMKFYPKLVSLELNNAMQGGLWTVQSRLLTEYSLGMSIKYT